MCVCVKCVWCVSVCPWCVCVVQSFERSIGRFSFKRLQYNKYSKKPPARVRNNQSLRTIPSFFLGGP